MCLYDVHTGKLRDLNPAFISCYSCVNRCTGKEWQSHSPQTGKYEVTEISTCVVQSVSLTADLNTVVVAECCGGCSLCQKATYCKKRLKIHSVYSIVSSKTIHYDLKLIRFKRKKSTWIWQDLKPLHSVNLLCVNLMIVVYKKKMVKCAMLH